MALSKYKTAFGKMRFYNANFLMLKNARTIECAHRSEERSDEAGEDNEARDGKEHSPVLLECCAPLVELECNQRDGRCIHDSNEELPDEPPRKRKGKLGKQVEEDQGDELVTPDWDQVEPRLFLDKPAYGDFSIAPDAEDDEHVDDGNKNYVNKHTSLL